MPASSCLKIMRLVLKGEVAAGAVTIIQELNLTGENTLRKQTGKAKGRVLRQFLCVRSSCVLEWSKCVPSKSLAESSLFCGSACCRSLTLC